jgi:hypothetical protein
VLSLVGWGAIFCAFCACDRSVSCDPEKIERTNAAIANGQIPRRKLGAGNWKLFLFIRSAPV